MRARREDAVENADRAGCGDQRGEEQGARGRAAPSSDRGAPPRAPRSRPGGRRREAGPRCGRRRGRDLPDDEERDPDARRTSSPRRPGRAGPRRSAARRGTRAPMLASSSASGAQTATKSKKRDGVVLGQLVERQRIPHDRPRHRELTQRVEDPRRRDREREPDQDRPDHPAGPNHPRHGSPGRSWCQARAWHRGGTRCSQATYSALAGLAAPERPVVAAANDVVVRADTERS